MAARLIGAGCAGPFPAAPSSDIYRAMTSGSKLCARLGLASLAAVTVAAAPAPVTTVAPARPPIAASKPAPPEPDKATPRIFLSADGTIVYIIGALTDDSFLRFDSLLLTAPKVRSVFLASPGGLTIEGRLIAAAARLGFEWPQG